MDVRLDTSLTQSESNLQTLQKIIVEDKIIPTTADYTNLKGEWDKVEQCQQHINEADEEIARLNKLLNGWRGFRDYQTKRLPALKQRYNLHRDYLRSAEDMQTEV